MKFPYFIIYAIVLCLVLQSYANQVSFIEYCSDDSYHNPVFFSYGVNSSGSIIMSKEPNNGSWYHKNMNCSVTFFTEKDFFLFLTFSNVSLRNSSMDNLTVIYNSDQSSLPLSGQQVCSNENCIGLKFDSGSFNNLTLVFQSANVSVPSNVTGFQAHYSVYSLVGKKGACSSRKQYLCENGHCIPNDLVCDDHNDCGDRSDETKCVYPVPDTIWGVVMIVIAIFCIFTFVPLFCCLALYGTRSIVRTVTVSASAIPLHPPAELGESSNLLNSSDFHSSSWPGTSYEGNASSSYGTAHNESTHSSKPIQKLRSMSEAVQSQAPKVL